MSRFYQKGAKRGLPAGDIGYQGLVYISGALRRMAGWEFGWSVEPWFATLVFYRQDLDTDAQCEIDTATHLLEADEPGRGEWSGWGGDL